MASTYGMLTVADLLATRDQHIIQYGEDRMFEVVDSYLNAQEEYRAAMVRDLVEDSTVRYGRVGAVDTAEMEDLDEFGRAHVQKGMGYDVQGWPLYLRGAALGWTYHWFLNHTPAELMTQVQRLVTADAMRAVRDIKRAIFYSTNVTVKDNLVDKVSLPVKRLINADSFPIDVDPNGAIFDTSTHTHYLARAGGSLAATDVDALLDTVGEHYRDGELLLYIPKGLETTVRGFNAANQFTPYLDARIVNGGGFTGQQAASGDLQRLNHNNRSIGIYREAEVWVKPWIPSNYILCFIRGNGIGKVVRRRIRDARNGSFHLVFDDENHPLRAREWAREEGYGVAERTAAAVLYTGGTTYADPTIN